ncbi:unnamed protein product [Parnassius apollo]|uniref:(apollo) hypothetical protein n=1 Tax=Parnassius apollo TaxID=110799 RepID=A0A8S3XXG5_PARAO|nr:unnamed protein product [Parnassius apollo]
MPHSFTIYVTPLTRMNASRGKNPLAPAQKHKRPASNKRAHGSKVVGGGVFRCCVPWCGARTAAPADDADYALRETSPQPSHEEYVIPEPVISSPRPIGQQSPLPGIEEEDDSDWPLEDATDSTLTPSYKSTISSTDTVYTSSRSSGKNRSYGSPSSVKICISAAARKYNKARKRGAGAVVLPQGQGGEDPPPQLLHGRMQAEQGSIGELQKYHGRYLKSRRHTLANVR